MRLQKKADGEFMFILQVVVLIIVIFGLKIFIASALGTTVKTAELEAHILAQRALYSSSGFAQIDKDSKRVYPGVIEEEKFTQGTMDALYDPESKAPFAVKATLVENNAEKTLYFHQDLYETIKPLTFSKKYASKNLQEYVLLKRENTLLPAHLEVEVVYATGE